MTRAPSRRDLTDVRVLAALAHPVRVQLLGYLLELGPHTATQCSAAVDASPSACSYHLRHLERFGLVERADADQSDPAPDGRERRWQASATGFSFGGPPSTATPALTAAQHALSLAAIDDNARLAKSYVGVADTLPAEWQDAAAFATYGIAVTPGELTTLVTAIDELVRPYIAATRNGPPATADRVHVTLQAFPRTEPR